MPPTIGQLLQITSNVTTEFNTTTFTGLVYNDAHLGNLFNGVVDGHTNLGNYFTSNNYLSVFAPVDSAFDQVDPDLLTRLLEPTWLMHLQSLCRNHFTFGIVSSGMKGPYNLTMLSDFTLTLDVLSPSTATAQANQTIGNATVLQIPGPLVNSFLTTSDA